MVGHFGRETTSRRQDQHMATRAVRDALISVAGLLGRPVLNQGGEPVGRVADLVVRYSTESADHNGPPLSGLIVKVGDRRSWISADQIATVSRTSVQLSSARLDLVEFAPRPGEVLLAGQVLDRQLLNVDGRKVIRAADLYVTAVGNQYRLVGVDVSLNALLRRLGPARWRTRPTLGRVIDWAAIQPLGDARGGVQARESTQALRGLRPGELADLLEELGRSERQQLLDVLDPELAADAVEEMQPDDVYALLIDSPPERARELLEAMEPDEAVDALRDMKRSDRDHLLGLLPAERAVELGRSLGYSEDRAGGFMTTVVFTVTASETVTEVRARLAEQYAHRNDLDRVVVIDDDGRVVDEVSMLEMLLAQPDTSMRQLVAPPWPVTVGPDATSAEVADQLIESRAGSVLVVDDDNRPIGRILADDIVDALVPERGRFTFLHWEAQ
ncbi:magnesium transporter MgtE N-terminal domain-containing protein [Mycolicibacterium sp. CBMA 226]|uniref:magnesium transporter MgtE N-terminal domain-containing protein n=1 Tax=Mycolicibacterium sp. CBMA 226 TaxID=2606611 RepID=UPI0012DED988|nr:CBS domain-containing protein [Mycolicibacterium sp. CBMA 226]MUL79737.1 magnesium transporter [Mycolicibacterium sp. CBMA 226]